MLNRRKLSIYLSLICVSLINAQLSASSMIVSHTNTTNSTSSARIALLARSRQCRKCLSSLFANAQLQTALPFSVATISSEQHNIVGHASTIYSIRNHTASARIVNLISFQPSFTLVSCANTIDTSMKVYSIYKSSVDNLQQYEFLCS